MFEDVLYDWVIAPLKLLENKLYSGCREQFHLSGVLLQHDSNYQDIPKDNVFHGAYVTLILQLYPADSKHLHM